MTSALGLGSFCFIYDDNGDNSTDTGPRTHILWSIIVFSMLIIIRGFYQYHNHTVNLQHSKKTVSSRDNV